jgi:hypothetical protein
LVDFDADPDAGVQSAARHQPCEKSNMTVFLTVLSGVLFFVLGQLALKLVIEPLNDMRKTIGLISHALIEHAGLIHNPGVAQEARGLVPSTAHRSRVPDPHGVCGMDVVFVILRAESQ